MFRGAQGLNEVTAVQNGRGCMHEKHDPWFHGRAVVESGWPMRNMIIFKTHWKVLLQTTWPKNKAYRGKILHTSWARFGILGVSIGFSLFVIGLKCLINAWEWLPILFSAFWELSKF